MNKERIQKCVDALRSGKYKQGRKALRNINDEFCCLGVFCDVSKEDLNIDWRLEPTDRECYMFSGSSGVLPNSMLSYLGIDCNNVLIKTTNSKLPISQMEKVGMSYLDREQVSLISLNDRFKLSFEQIADILEEEFLK
jgi:hypothetical protein